MIPPEVERCARWVLDTLGARDLGFGDDVPYVESAWEQVDRCERPVGDDIAAAFYHLARLEELDAGDGRSPRDQHGRFPASATCLDLDDPPLERLRQKLGLEPPRWRGARFAVCLTHDVDTPWRWTRIGIRGAAARLRDHARGGRAAPAMKEAIGLASVPIHKLGRSDPNWRFEPLLRKASAGGLRHTFYLMAGHGHPADGPSPAEYDRLRPQLVELLLAGGAEVGLHGSYLAAADAEVLTEEKRRLEELAGPLPGHRYHYLRVDPHRNLTTLDALGFRYDSTLGFADRPGFRAGIAQPFRPWDIAAGRPLRLVEIPLAVMDVTLAEERYLGLSVQAAERRLLDLVGWAAGHGGGFAVLWHNDRFDPLTSRGWDRLFYRFVDAVGAAGGVCLSGAELAEEADEWLAR